jgi:hypothetical protein
VYKPGYCSKCVITATSTGIRLSWFGLGPAEMNLGFDAVRAGRSLVLEHIMTNVRMEERRGKSYTSDRAYVVRERYILVAAIAIVII